MPDFLSAAIGAIPQAASSGLALAAYAMATVAYMFVTWRVTRNKNLLAHIAKLPAKDRLPALRSEMGSIEIKGGLAPEDWIRARIHKYYFLSFVVTCGVGIIVLCLALFSKPRLPEVVVDIYRESSTLRREHEVLQALRQVFLRPALAQDAEFQDPNQMRLDRSGGSLADRALLARYGNRTSVNYNYEQSPSGIVVRPSLPYLDAQRAGEVVEGFRWTWEPFSWNFPILSVRISNNTSRTILISQAVFNVSDSRMDNRPVFAVAGETYNGDVFIVNEGWGAARDGRVAYSIQRRSSCQAWQETRPFTTVLGNIADSARFNITNSVSPSMMDEITQCSPYIDSLCLAGTCVTSRELQNVTCLDRTKNEICEHLSHIPDGLIQRTLRDTRNRTRVDEQPRFIRTCRREPVCVQGELTFVQEGALASALRFSTIVSLDRPLPQAPRPPSYTYGVFLEAGRRGYISRLPLSQEIKPGETDQFLIRVGTNRSADFKFRMEIQDASGRSIWGNVFDMQIFVPRNSTRYVNQQRP
jgi:hypothetical protein